MTDDDYTYAVEHDGQADPCDNEHVALRLALQIGDTIQRDWEQDRRLVWVSDDAGECALVGALVRRER